jgi:folate-dependent phosphoribosylglycinamide formyltransferase PurN
MNLLILTHDNERHFFLVNEIIKNCNFNIKVITGGKNGPTKQKISLRRVKNFLLNKFYFTSLKNLINEKKRTEKEYFGGQASIFYDEFSDRLMASVLIGESINDQKYVKQVSEFKPDILIVMGTIIIKEDIFTIAKKAINFHTGLSPYYRGGLANLWPIVNNEFDKCGFTIHKLTNGIDNGEIFASGRVNLSDTTTFSSINCEAIVSGTRTIVQMLNEFLTGQDFILTAQWQKGNYYKNSDFNGFIAHKYFKNIKRYRHYLKNDRKFDSDVKTVELRIK